VRAVRFTGTNHGSIILVSQGKNSRKQGKNSCISTSLQSQLE